MKEQQSPKLWLLVRCTKGWLVGLGIKEVAPPQQGKELQRKGVLDAAECVLNSVGCS